MSGIKLQHWSDDRTKQEVSKRYRQAQQARRRLEDQWDRNESSAFGFDGVTGSSLLTDINGGLLGGYEGDGDEDSVGDSIARTNVAYTFKNLRFIHSQLSANPPSVAMRPTSSDQEDGRKADAADRTSRYNIRQYRLQENTDTWTLQTLTYGLGAIKTVWDSTLGAIIEFNTEADEVKLEGDISVSIPHTRNVFIDPDARSCGIAPDVPNGIKWIIERIYMDYDLAMAKWPTRSEVLKKARIENDGSSYGTRNQEEHYNCVELLEYWETGLPTNGYMGRYCVTTTDGEVIESCRPSPFRFPKAGSISAIMSSDKPDEIKDSLIARLPQMARLPYHILTDIDVPNCVWGKSTLEYAAPLQDILSSVDTATIDNIRAHGVARMVVSNQSEVDLDLSNSGWDVTKVDSNQAPFFMEVPQLMPEMTSTRQNMIQGINDTMGTNEAMMGQQSREQSGASMQYATNQGNMIRRRLFNKYVLGVESLHKGLLDLERKHWTLERTIRVLGKEKAFESIALKGADIDGGYDVVGEYGVTLSLDPMTRREEIMALQPMFEKAGLPPRVSLKMMKLNELEGMYDALEKAEDRQREVFDEMIATQRLIEPETMMDHENMIAWALEYFMSAEFKYLDDSSKELCKEHIRKRIALAASEKAPAVAGTPGPTPAPTPEMMPASPVAPPEMLPQ